MGTMTATTYFFIIIVLMIGSVRNGDFRSDLSFHLRGEGDYVAPFGLNKTTIYGYNVASCVEGLLDTESGSSLLD